MTEFQQVGETPKVESPSTFVFTIENSKEIQTVHVNCHKLAPEDAKNPERRLRVAIKALRKERPFRSWKIVHVFEKTLPTLD